VTALQIAFVVAIAVLVALGTGVVRRLALKRSWLDIPNERSSHTVPTPRGGGVAIALALLGGLSIATALGWVSRPFGIGVLVGGSLVAAIGWIDDRRSVGVVKRIIVHLAAAIVGVMLLGGVPSVRFGAEVIQLGPAGSVLAVLFVVWCVNLYNFMDGIDGIAAVETASIGGGVALVVLGAAVGPAGAAACGIALAAAALGFLPWNWQRAKLFLGDVGSVPLGYLSGWLLLSLAAAGAWKAALILPLYYLADATITLLLRLKRGEKVWRAHREHYYQRAVQGGMSHASVVKAVLAGNLALAGLALGAETGLGFLALVMAATVAAILLYRLAFAHVPGPA
jgi:UDP-N-acetylmuramyl pentapeptide phosphotransferase/UDP-N-acetylglucosamine-1-phosphate transferase